MKQITFKSLVLISFLFLAGFASGQSNLILNPNADSNSENWRVFGEGSVEEFNGDKVFVVRNRGYFIQDVNLTESDVGKYALLIGRGATERINVDGAITGLPYLHGYMMNPGKPSGGKIYLHMQGQKMLARPRVKDEWVTLFGIFQVPEGTGRVRFFLNQAERQGVPQNGSAARFDNLGLYLFETEEDALQFVRAYK